MTNRRRAETARLALRHFADTTGMMGEETTLQLKDLLTNLMHFCALTGLDFKDILVDAKVAHNDEKGHPWDEEDDGWLGPSEAAEGVEGGTPP